jgi:heptosyltransferase-2
MKKNKFNTDKKSPSFGGVGEASGEALKILVIQQKMIGDVLTSSIICENLKRNFPDAEVHYLINRFTIPVVDNNPYIDQFVIFEDEYKQSKLRFYKFLKQISRAKYTHVFDAYGKLESLLISKFSKAKFKYGFKKSYSKFYYSKTVKMTNEVKTEAGSAIENRLRLLQLMPDISIFNSKPKIYLTQKETENAISQFKVKNVNPQNCIMISALGSSPEKTYPFEYLGEILNFIVKKTDKKLILNYMPSQQKFIDDLLGFCNQKTKSSILDGIEMKGLRSFMCICSQCCAIIGNEGGAINMAKALDVPSFSVFSPWVTKEGWNSFEKSYHNDSVHLKDFEPEIYNKHSKKYKDRSLELYQLLKPGLFKDQLEAFLNELK